LLPMAPVPGTKLVCLRLCAWALPAGESRSQLVPAPHGSDAASWSVEGGGAGAEFREKESPAPRGFQSCIWLGLSVALRSDCFGGGGPIALGGALGGLIGRSCHSLLRLRWRKGRGDGGRGQMSASGFLARGNIISANGRMVARWVGRRRRRTRGDVTGLPRYGTIVGPPIVMRLLGVRPDLPASAVSGTFSESTPSLSTLCVIENFRGDPTGAAAAVLPQPPPTGSAQGSAMVAGVQEDARLEARPCVRHASDARVSTVVPSEGVK
jgi:hypothetical protein